ncbi:Oidioi.mRNA.OKI2018_I69.PAR.g10222.t1.cds [Oikopleura dioica]|uniref:Oidioi.mRNA.OKI2018_I69.PAR.g10222.t1.cds n=1 Tax=Oikopleura dioica TaxID=34765 RepID=A0ABN7RPK1_OIKDI|nr:Oidioi.mRNA.OKI2018_I69.PAR.g10222.t1.cds [Oikopleura dioica]
MKSSFGDTASLVETSSAVHNPDSLCRSSQYRSCLFRSGSDFLSNPNLSSPKKRSTTSSTLEILQDAADSITCATDATTCNTEELISPEFRPKSSRSRFDKNPVPSGLTPIKQNDNDTKKLEAEQREREAKEKIKRNSEGYQNWLKQKEEHERRLREEKERRDELRSKRAEKERQKKAEEKEKAEEKFQEWRKAKDEAEKKAKQAAKEKRILEQKEAGKKREENEKKFKEWLKKVNETNPKESEDVFTNKPWVPPIPKSIPTKRKQNRPQSARPAGRPRSAIQSKPLIITRQSTCFVNWS